MKFKELINNITKKDNVKESISDNSSTTSTTINDIKFQEELYMFRLDGDTLEDLLPIMEKFNTFSSLRILKINIAIGSKKASVSFQVLESNPHINTIHMIRHAKEDAFRKISNEETLALYNLIKHNKYIEYINLEAYLPNESIAMTILHGLQHNKSIQKIKMDCTLSQKNEFEQFVKMLENNETFSRWENLKFDFKSCPEYKQDVLEAFSKNKNFINYSICTNPSDINEEQFRLANHRPSNNSHKDNDTLTSNEKYLATFKEIMIMKFIKTDEIARKVMETMKEGSLYFPDEFDDIQSAVKLLLKDLYGFDFDKEKKIVLEAQEGPKNKWTTLMSTSKQEDKLDITRN